MERQQIHCERCQKETEHTFRYHTQKTKHYSSFSFGEGDKSVTIICHGCLLERSLEKNYEREMIDKFDCEIATGMAHELIEKGEPNNAQKLLKKLLKKNPNYGPGIFAMAKCLLSQKKYDEAEIYVINLETDYPNNEDVEELRRMMTAT
jgi:tetratricopeptide (TPR) repeat protein